MDENNKIKSESNNLSSEKTNNNDSSININDNSIYELKNKKIDVTNGGNNQINKRRALNNNNNIPGDFNNPIPPAAGLNQQMPMGGINTQPNINALRNNMLDKEMDSGMTNPKMNKAFNNNNKINLNDNQLNNNDTNIINNKNELENNNINNNDNGVLQGQNELDNNNNGLNKTEDGTLNTTSNSVANQGNINRNGTRTAKASGNGVGKGSVNSTGTPAKDKAASSAKDSAASSAKSKAAGAAGLGSSIDPAASAQRIKNKMNEEDKSLGEAVKEEAQDVVKEEAKRYVKEIIKKQLVKLAGKLIAALAPALPYIGVALLVILAIATLFFIFSSYFINDDIVAPTMEVNYCSKVNLRWNDDESQKIELSSDQYIAYEISSSPFAIIDDEEAIKAMAIVYRTNLYANANNLNGDTCFITIDESEVTVDENNQYIFVTPIDDKKLDLVKKTENKAFAYNMEELSELPIDEYFSYVNIDKTSYGEQTYILAQDELTYRKSWIDQHVPSEYIHEDTPEKYSFSPFAAWYLAAEGDDYEYHTLLYHFYTPSSVDGHIVKIEKINAEDSYLGDGVTNCSDMSLVSTTLTREEFIQYVRSYHSSHSDYNVFKTYAGEIYDICKKNNFNPEFVVVRAIGEGFSPGGSTYNYWGIGCANGKKCSVSYSSFEEGVIGFINVVRKINSESLYKLMYKYAYIGSNWFNPGGSGKGGCYYFNHIKKYLSEERAATVAPYCAEGNTCPDNQCLPTTAEDQSAYTRWQMEKMINYRQSVFKISPEDCEEKHTEEEGERINVPFTGKDVAEYAVKTYDSWGYSQGLRDSVGYVDCSSMVARAYAHFSMLIYNGSFNSSGNTEAIYKWCEGNHKTISGGSLEPGDLIFYNSGDYANSSHYLSIGHVSMYIGNNQIFAAHSSTIGTGANKRPRPWADQVSVTPYRNNGNLFCRPLKK